MNNENQNQTNNQDTVEQDQNSGGPAPAKLTNPASAAASSDLGSTNPNIQESINPASTPTMLPELASTATPVTDNCPPANGSDNILATELQTRNSEPETQHQAAQLETPNPELETQALAPQLEARNAEPETQPITPAALATGDGQRTTNKPRKRSSRPRVGKVAKLPEELRNFVNEQILRGISFEYIKTVLKEKGYPGISASNLSRWKLGGYREWVMNQESAAAQQARRDEALKLAREKGSDLEEATIQLAMARYHSFFARVDLVAMEPQLADNPEHIIGLIRGLSHLVTANRALKQKQAVISHPGRPGRPAAARDLTDFESQEKNGGLSEETLKKITTAIKLF